MILEYIGQSATSVPGVVPPVLSSSSSTASLQANRSMKTGLSKLTLVMSGMVTLSKDILFARVIPETARTILLALLNIGRLRLNLKPLGMFRAWDP